MSSHHYHGRENKRWKNRVKIIIEDIFHKMGLTSYQQLKRTRCDIHEWLQVDDDDDDAISPK